MGAAKSKFLGVPRTLGRMLCDPPEREEDADARFEGCDFEDFLRVVLSVL
jgi:hypothetical protein